MGCNHSTKKSKGKKGEKTQRGVKQQDGGGNVEKQYDWQVRVLKEVLLANGTQERAELLKGHAHGELCSLVQSILDKIKTETAAELNVVQEQRNQKTAQEHHRNIEELQKRHDEESGVLKEQVDVLSCELKEFQELKKRVQQSSFTKDLQRNIPAHGNRGEFWEKQFESLLFVIEMKSELVREQEIKLQHMAALKEENQALRDQIDNVLKQNEDLTVQKNKNQTLIKQQITEQQALQVALERQTAVNQALCQEKEELLFRLRQKDPCQDLQRPLVVTDVTSR